jgi:hypothetical protein
MCSEFVENIVNSFIQWETLNYNLMSPLGLVYTVNISCKINNLTMMQHYIHIRLFFTLIYAR